MEISVNIHRPGKAEANSRKSTTWVDIGGKVAIFTDNIEDAKSIADAINKAFGHE